jgi:hypothetical protein
MTVKRSRKVLVVVIVLLLLLAAAAYFVNRHRDSIALEVARSALRGSDVQVSDVRVDSVTANEVHFDAVVLELADGATVFIEGVTLPVRFSGLRNNRLHIDTLRFLPGTADAGLPRLALFLQRFLDAPATAPGATIAIDEVVLPGVPPISDFAWHADPLNPTLRATVDDLALIMTTTQVEDGAYRGTLRVLLPDDTEALMLGLRLAPGDSGFRVNGDVSLMLAPFLPVLRAAGAVPQGLASLTASLSGTFEFDLSADETLPVSVVAMLRAPAPVNVTYRAGDTAVELSVIEASPVDATFEYPSLDWSAQFANALVSIGGTDLDLPPVRLRNGDCRSGIRCSTALDLSCENLVIGELAIGKLTAVTEAAELAALADDWRVSSPDTRITLQNLAIGELTIGKITAVTEAAKFVALADDWQVSSPDTRITLQNLAVAGRHVVAPAIVADLAGSSESVTGTARFTTPEGGLSGDAAFSHNLATAEGRMTLESAALDFAALNLSGIFADWRYPVDVTAGRVMAEADVDWSAQDAGFAYEAAAQVSADALAGRYADIGFVGASTRLDMESGSATQAAVQPARFEIALVDVGFPIENISGTAAPDIEASAVAVSQLSMSLLGGTVTADPFRYDPAAESNALMLRANGIQLPLMAALADLEAVTISGSVSGEIPVTILGNTVIIDGGHLENDPPGGVLRYRGGAADGIVDDSSQLGIVTRMLRNFEFDSLTSAVNYSQAGDLVLNMRLEGMNPDVDPTQPVILNLNIENNVPQLLRSLQATRSIEDVLEERLSK